MASGVVKDSKLKVRRYTIAVSNMTLVGNYYYKYEISQDHAYIMGIVTGWGGNSSPFFGSYDPTDKTAYFMFGDTVPQSVTLHLYYYE